MVFKKTVSTSFFQIGKQENKMDQSVHGSISPKIINELPAPTKQILVTEMLSKPKNPKDYQGREVIEHEPAPIVLSTKLVAETVEIKKTNNFDKIDGSTKKVMGMRTAKRRAGKKKENFQRQLSENTARMNIIKKSRIQ